MLRIKLCVGAVAASVACIGGTGSDVQPEVAVAPLAAADTSRNPSWKPNSDTVPSSPPLTPLASLAAQPRRERTIQYTEIGSFTKSMVILLSRWSWRQ